MSLPSTYKKLVAVQASDNFREAVEVQVVPLEPPAADELLVRTMVCGTNAADYLMAAGRYLASTKPPYDLGAEAAGEVVAVGADVDNYSIGDYVLAIGGGYREYFTVKARNAIPAAAATPEIVTLGVSGLTASIALEKVAELSSGEVVLVTAAAGGTGNLAVQLAKLAGNTVIGTCSTDEKIEFLRSLGCDRPINYKQENMRSVLKEEFRRGVDIVFECVGGEQYDIALNALAVKGRMVLIGAISEYESGPQEVTRPRVSYQLLQKSASMRGFWLMHYLQYAGEHLRKLNELIENGQLQAPVDPTEFQGVEGAIDAVEYLYSGQNVGKVVVRLG